MRVLNRLIKATFFCFLMLDSAIFILMYIATYGISNNYKIGKGETLKLNTSLPVTAVYKDVKNADSKLYDIGDTFEVDLKMFGVIPFSTANVEVVDEMHVAVLGNPFGMKIYTNGVLAIELADIKTENGTKNPAKEAGIKVGDYIVSVNGTKISCNEDLSDIVSKSQGKKLRFKIKRSGKTLYINVTPVISYDDGTYKVGIWVRDSSAGIGTLTFYSPSSEIVCGLGHGICDDDTGSLLTLDSGEMVGAQILSVDKGKSGTPGELKGSFTFETVADINLNCKLGVYGKLKGKIDGYTLTEVALKQDVEDGAAQILCTVNGESPKLYSCTVKKRNNASSNTQTLLVTVTDKELLSETGGIVQGMSGSPILQNGKLIGAVTHVLIDDPTTGYGIFAENMLETAQSVANENKLKDAS